jgi:hypothetical protein
MKEIYKPQTFLSVILNSKNEDTTSLFFRTKAAAFMRNKYAFLLLAFLLFLGGNVWGQTTYTWSGSSSSAWLTVANWSSSGHPGAFNSNTNSDIAYFNNNTQLTVGINMNNGSPKGIFYLGAINIGTSATSARTIKNSAGSQNGTLFLNGVLLNSLANTIIWNQSSNTHTITNGTPALNIALNNVTNNVIQITGTGSVTINSTIINGSGSNLTKAGSGSGVLTLGSAANSYSGTTTITAGELRLNPSNTTATFASQINLNGGTLSTTAITPNTTITSSSTLNVSENSIIALGSNVHSLKFAASNGVSWTSGKVITITGWTGTIGACSTGTAGKIFVGSTTSGLTAAQLAQIKFTISGVDYPATILTTGELVPILKLVVTNPGNQIDGTPFAVTVTSVDFNGTAINVTANTGITLTSTNAISGTTTATINSGASTTAGFSGVILAAGTNATITAVSSSGNCLLPGTSTVFDVTSSGGPSLSTTALTDFGTQCANATYGPNKFTITGTALTTADVTVGALSGFTYSTTAGGTYTTSLTLSQGGGAYSQDIYVKFSPISGSSYNGSIGVGGGGASNINVAAKGTGIAPVTPAVSTSAATSVSYSSATLNGNVTTLGVCPNSTEKGFVYAVTATNSSPAVGGSGVSKVVVGSIATGIYNTGLTGLSSSTQYSVTAYVFDGTTYTYGTTLTFTTLDALTLTGTLSHGSVCPGSSTSSITYTIKNNSIATVTGITVSSNNTEFAVSGLSSTSITAGSTATYKVTFTPASAGSKNATITVSAADAASVSNTVTGTGIAPVTPAVSTSAATSVSYSSATLNGNVTTLGVCPNSTEKGFVYAETATNASPIVGGTGVTKTPVGSISTGSYNTGLTGLTPSTNYSFRAYVYDGTTYTYGTILNFTTLTPPANDECSNATTLTVNAAAISGTLLYSNYSSPFTSKNDVWYKFTATCPSTHTITVSGFSGDVDVYLFDQSSACPTSTTSVASSTGSTSTETINYTVTSGTTYYIRVIAYNSVAESSTFNIQVTGTTTVPTQPNPIVGETSPCPGVEEVYSVDPVAGATSYTWTLPSGWSGSSTTNSITATSGTSGGTISVTANNACGSSTPSTLAVSILTTPSAPTATAGTAIDGASFTANWNSVAGATGYYVDVYTSNPSPTDLFISEYVEGSSNNKYIEIYNGTGASVNLSNYKLRLFANGNSSPTNDITLSGTLADGAVIVYQNSGSTIYAGSTTDNAACNFNGDDAVALYKTTTSSYVDIFGRIGEDPGTAWTAAGGYSTLDKTLVRKSSIISGVSSNPSSGFPTLATEWDLYSQDDVSHLGSHDIVAGKQYVLGYENVYTTSTSLVVTGLSPNTTYYYVVRADNGNCSSPNSNEINVTTTSCAAATHTVTSILPTTGPVGTRVMITGTGFTNVTDITMGGVAVTDFTVLNTTTIIVRIPSGATTNSINIYNSGCPKASPTFTVLISDGNCGAGGAITASDLFISEVYDAEVGSRGYIEIYNGTGAAVNLSSYKLKIYTGATTWVTLSGTLGINQFAVVKIGNSGTNCDATISATGALLINRSTSSGYNKNDYIELYKGTTKIDRVQTPNETGFNLERNTLTGAPSPTFNAANWTLTSTETCSTLGTSSLTSNPLLVINTSPIDNSICPVGSIQFSVAATANPSPVSTYNWYYNNSLDMAGWQLVSGNIASATGTNTATLTLPADFAPLYNYQFYCVVTKSNGGNTCTKYTDAARFIYPTARYYRTKLSTTNGSWTTASEWEMTDDANFVSPTPITACAYPCSANSSAAVIQNGTKTTIGDGIASFTTDIDKLTIENTGTLELHTKSKITVYDSTAAGADIIVNGTLIDRGSTSNGVYFTGSSYTNGSGWILGNAGTIIKTNASSVDDYKTHYQDGISNIPDGSSGAKWTYSYNGDGNPSVNAVGMYYPNLYFENTTGVFHDFITATSLLKGTTDYCTVKGNMFIGTTGSSGVQIYNNNTYSQAMKILGSLSIGSGSSFTNISYNGSTSSVHGYGTGIELFGNLTNNGTLTNNANSTGILMFSGGATQAVSGSGTFNLWNVELNKNTQTLVDQQVNLTADNKLNFNSGGILKTGTNVFSVSNGDAVNAVTGFQTPFIANTGAPNYSNDKYVWGKLERYINSSAIYVYPIGDAVAGEGYNPLRFDRKTGDGKATAQFIPVAGGAGNCVIGPIYFSCGGVTKFFEYQKMTSEGKWNMSSSTGTTFTYDIYLHPNQVNLDIYPNEDANADPLFYKKNYRALKSLTGTTDWKSSPPLPDSVPTAKCY